ncbi:PRAME family member 12-like [Peromyscus californicus insignis]|uniref:PRAME family member 12-like n=1 Tax=Peromyscus californicus insignis TaxID=564181 RepID=UPI0022A6D2BC|nr:PRAME family member 12-like [Peromyscus californicus insignis]
MSLEAPSTLLGLAVKSLLRHEALAISVLQQLPTELFPSLFKEVFKSRHMKILTAMVAVWPFSCLPVGALMQIPDVVILQAVLDGVDMLLKQQVHLRRSKLRVLDLKKVHHVFWDVFMMVFNTFKPYYIEEMCLSIRWTPRVLSRFAHCFGQMRNLFKLHLARISVHTNKAIYTLEDVKKYTARFIAQISKLKCLQELIVNDSYFSSEHMKQLFRCLKTPLESLSIKLRKCSPLGLKHLSECQWLFELKHLNLFGVSLFNFCPTARQVLLKSVADTLQTLQISNCCIRDSQHSALLPVLSQCLQLTHVNFYDTVISISALKDLLQSLANLSKITEEHYPAPLECYDDQGHVLVNKFANVCLDLLNILRVKRQPKVIDFATNICRKCFQRCVFDGKTRLCPCLS